jgi:hypothetical protein
MWHTWSIGATVLCYRPVQMMSLLSYQSCVWFDYAVHLVFSSAAFVFLTIASGNVYLHHLVQKKKKNGERQLVFKRN